MVLLSTSQPSVFVYPSAIEQASRKQTATGCAAYLLNVFYTNEELVGRNLTGANGREAVNKEILGSIIGKTF